MFVTSSEYEKMVTSISEEEGELFAAVAFWGLGADSIISRRSGRSVKLTCNLASGATNPDVIQALRNKKGILVRQHDRLHAKVIVGGKSALVGSANFSSNGLNLEGSELSGWEEAGLVTADSRQIAAIREWFTAMWRESRQITDSELEDARRKWKERRVTRISSTAPASSGHFSLAQLSREDLTDREVYLAIYRNWVSDEAEKAYRKYENELTGKPLPKSTEPPPMYENWPELPEDAQLIDLYYGPRSALRCLGVFTRIHDVKFEYRDGSKGHLAVCRRDDRIIGYPFGNKEAARFAKDIRPHIEKVWNSEFAVGDDYGKCIHLVKVMEICG